MPSCPRPDKVDYDEAGARRAAQFLNANRLPGDSVVEAYHCPCGDWHVGRPSVNQKIERALRSRKPLPGLRGGWGRRRG